MTIAVDFDGTCVTHEFPLIGKEIGAPSVLKKVIQSGHRIILFTMRSGERLDEAVDWFNKNDIPLYGVNENPNQKNWTLSPKPYANLYIDDAALGCPLTYMIDNLILSDRLFVDWVEVEKQLIDKKYINE